MIPAKEIDGEMCKPREPVTNHSEHDLDMVIAPPKRKPLTDEEIATAIATAYSEKPMTVYDKRIARAIERAHGIGEKD